MSASMMTAAAAQAVITSVASRSTISRRRKPGVTRVSGEGTDAASVAMVRDSSGSRRGTDRPAGNAPHQQARQDIHDARHQHEYQGNLDDRAEVNGFVGLGELIGDSAGEGVAGGEQTRTDLRR